MEHESFEDPEIARLLNESFVCVKVDREERPDVDQLYMNAVQLLTGRGGWPMSVFLTPQLKPFYAGTYWPARSRMGMPGFDQVLRAVADAWRVRRDQVEQAAEEITRRLTEFSEATTEQHSLNVELLDRAVATLQRMCDFHHGGFGGAPKFPHAVIVRFLLRYYFRTRNEMVRQMVTVKLDKMAAGGIYDHLGGGFARYSVDERWLVPHFEKMLYDNALLATAYLEAYSAMHQDLYARVARETLDYVLRDMTDASGGFYSSEDADSEGEEGKFYLWTPQEIREVLGDDLGQLFCQVYDVTEVGNFEGKNILNLPKSLQQCAALYNVPIEQLTSQMAAARRKLFEHRNARVRPGKDTKILTSWNALMIEALALGAGVLQEQRYQDAACKAAGYLWEELRGHDGRLYHCRRSKDAYVPGFLDDYAALIVALLALYEVTFDETWVARAVELADRMISEFEDSAGGGFYYSPSSQQELIVRAKDYQDSGTPSANGMAAMALLRLGHLTGVAAYEKAATTTLQVASGWMAQWPLAVGQLLLALDWWLGPRHELVFVGDKNREPMARWVQAVWQRFLPRRILALRDPADSSACRTPLLDTLFHGRLAGPVPAFYLCQNYTCHQPVTHTEQVQQLLNEVSM
jgi:hypothetical protein